MARNKGIHRVMMNRAKTVCVKGTMGNDYAQLTTIEKVNPDSTEVGG